MEQKKQQLIDALQKERKRFEDRGQSTKDHDLTIEYLKTGKYPDNYERYEILDAAINDFDMLYSDYCVH